MIKKKIGDDSYETLQIIGLETRADSFLQSTKFTIRDCGILIGLFFEKSFDHKFNQIIDWSKKEFGEKDNFTRWLDSQYNWIKQVIDMRNALEHPKDGIKNKLHIVNIGFDFSGSKVTSLDPVWFLTGDLPSSLIIDIKNLNRNILQFEEDIIAFSLMKKFPEFPIYIQEIPENSRDLKCPVRLELVPKGGFLDY
jgi:hypothetical protein